MAKGDIKQIVNTRTWYSNKYQTVLLQKNLFSLFTVFALITVIIAIFFVKNLTESKSFEPFVIEMEDKTGNIQIVENLNVTKLTADETVKRYFIYNFLKVSEGYNYATYKEDMVQLGLYTNSSVYNQLMRKIGARNELSPVNILGLKGYMYIQIKSIIFLTPQSCTVRFVTINTSANKIYPNERHFVAYIEFDFKNLDLTMTERFINPLGFQVEKYRLDNDLIPRN